MCTYTQKKSTKKSKKKKTKIPSNSPIAFIGTNATKSNNNKNKAFLNALLQQNQPKQILPTTTKNKTKKHKITQTKTNKTTKQTHKRYPNKIQYNNP